MAGFVVPEGWVVQAYRYALDLTPTQESMVRSHTGAARFARNHMLAFVKAVMEQRAAEQTYGIEGDDLTPMLGWTLPSLRKTWNARKEKVAPWWSENSKEAYSTGLDSLARSLDGWSTSRKGTRAGAQVGFPRFHNRQHRQSVRFTTGVIRVEPDRHHIALPRLGRLKTHESTRKLARRLETGMARILSATVSLSGGRWYVSFQTLVQRTVQRPAHVGVRHPVVGVDVGVKDLLVVATPDGVEVDRVPAPRSLSKAQVRLRALQRKAARQQGSYNTQKRRKQEPSNRWKRTQNRITKAHAQAANIRRDVLHKATTRLAQAHEVVVVETLNVTGMRTKVGAHKKGLNRAISDAALAEIRRMLSYKTGWYGSRLVEADRWYPSSKTCSGCGRRKPNLSLADRTYHCTTCGISLDRDTNAAINLARLGLIDEIESMTAGSGPVNGRGATQKTNPTRSRGHVGEAAGDETSTPTQPQLGIGTAAPEGTATFERANQRYQRYSRLLTQRQRTIPHVSVEPGHEHSTVTGSVTGSVTADTVASPKIEMPNWWTGNVVMAQDVLDAARTLLYRHQTFYHVSWRVTRWHSDADLADNIRNQRNGWLSGHKSTAWTGDWDDQRGEVIVFSVDTAMDILIAGCTIHPQPVVSSLDQMGLSWDESPEIDLFAAFDLMRQPELFDSIRVARVPLPRVLDIVDAFGLDLFRLAAEAGLTGTEMVTMADTGTIPSRASLETMRALLGDTTTF